MLRFIIRRRCKDRATGLESEGFETLDIETPELEEILRSGGMAEDGYDAPELAGVEILTPKLSELSRAERSEGTAAQRRRRLERLVLRATPTDFRIHHQSMLVRENKLAAHGRSLQSAAARCQPQARLG